MKKPVLILLASILFASCNSERNNEILRLNEAEYFERQGVNILVYSNLFDGGFNDEKTSGLEVIHHGVRTVHGGAVRLSHTPEQWDLVPSTTSRTVNTENGSIGRQGRFQSGIPAFAILGKDIYC